MSIDDTAPKRTAALFAWLNQVKADDNLPASAFKVAFELGQWINGEAFAKDGTLLAWPSLETIGAAIRMSERTARDMVRRLELRSHLSIKIGRGPGHPSRYTFIVSNRQPAAGLAELETVIQGTETGSGLPHSEDGNRQSDVPKPAVQRHETGSRLPTNHLEPFLNHERESARATLLQDDFRLDDQTYGWALDRLGSNEAVDRAMSRFVNHYRQVTGDRSKSRDWQAKARNWIDDDANKQQPDKSVVGAAKRLQEKLASFSARPEAVTDVHWDSVLSTYAKTGHWTRFVDQFGSAPSSPECRVPQRLLIKHGIIKEAAA
jgi:hypothetical protein